MEGSDRETRDRICLHSKRYGGEGTLLPYSVVAAVEARGVDQFPSGDQYCLHSIVHYVLPLRHVFPLHDARLA